MNRFTLVACIIFFSQHVALSQQLFPVNGVHDERPRLYAFTNATIVADHQTQIKNATLLIRDGRIEAVGTDVNVPAGASVVDLAGKFIYPSFIDLNTGYGLPAVEDPPSDYGPPQIESETEGAFNWNEAIRPEYSAISEFSIDNNVAQSFRESGFGAVVTYKPDGIARGASAMVSLAEGKDNEVIIKDQATAQLSFDKGSSQQNYPNSLMGTIALLRQTYLDADWYSTRPGEKIHDQSLENFNQLKGLPQIFQVDGKFSLLRADKLGDEFGIQYIIYGNGDEYQRIAEVKATNAPLIIPVNFPDAYEVEDPYDAVMVSLEDMKHWELAPTNLAVLAENDIPFAITSDQLEDKADFLKNVRKAIAMGLSEQNALKALTVTPAYLINAFDQVGSLEVGKMANFLIASGPIFEEKAIIFENWVQGNKYEMEDIDLVDHAGTYELNIGNLDPFQLEITGEASKPAFKVTNDEAYSTTANGTIESGLISLNFKPDSTAEGNIRLSGWVSGENLQGDGQLPDGAWVKWQAVYTGELEEENSEEDNAADSLEQVETGQVIFPFTAYGTMAKPAQHDYLIKNATVWTNEAEGILTNADVLVRNGKINQVGQNLAGGNALVIDGTGKHLTSGIIDEHSHIAVSQGINEGTQAVTAEVRVGDVIDPEDINIYRQLAGGVTASQLLHGSANPIGGQSAIVKLRWGASPEEMKMEGAAPFIKFALGENVKQSNRNQFYTTRFPQTRMGVEQVFYDAFTRAKEYQQEWDNYNDLSNREKDRTAQPRRDLELETLVEILKDERFISCHSYVQSEINMMMKAAEDLGFKVNTFTHILEGYKVADKMVEHGAGGSTFADWWAYKFEVWDAIPYNAALMASVGVITAINSDDAEMGRRLNQEAAKIVKYGGVSEEEAWKMVTLNPAKLLHLDDRMGSIKAGKDADLVLWNEHPLSIYARPEKTMIDGIIYFDLEHDAQLQEQINQERARLIQKMISAKAQGEPTQKTQSEPQHIWHCEDVH